MYQNPHEAFVASTCFQPARSRGPAAGTAWRSLHAGAPARRQADGGTRAAIISTGTATGKILPTASVPYRSIDNSE